jgi:alkanesulfonate monooxygenase SsuD/methylene tetrahydromethanopterin reductase-like flavin-dependent oxidoreductase (luciferase family)
MQQDRTTPMQFGWFMPGGAIPGKEQVPVVAEQLRDTLPAVAEHFDSIWVPDHFYAFTEPSDGWVECWTTLTWLAATFPRIKVGPIVLGVGYRNPALLARMAATLQLLSGGRFVMGIGAGWREPEYTAYGYPFPPAKTRIAQLEEAVEIMRLMWTQPAPTYQGQHFQIQNAYCDPRPTPPPLMIGGGGEKLLLPLAGRVADIWDRYHGDSLEKIDLEEYRRKAAIVHEHAAKAGRDPSSIIQSFTIENGVMPESQQDSNNWRAHLQPLIDLGVTHFIIGSANPSTPDHIHRFAAQVINSLRPQN